MATEEYQKVISDRANDGADNVSSIVLFESADREVTLSVNFDGETVWLNKEQMGTLFGRDRTVISRHISNLYREGELDREETCAFFAQVRREGKRNVVRQDERFNLDVIISVGYRVKSQRGVEFRRWATNVLRRYIIEGHAENEQRLAQLGQITRIMARIPYRFTHNAGRTAVTSESTGQPSVKTRPSTPTSAAASS